DSTERRGGYRAVCPPFGSGHGQGCTDRRRLRAAAPGTAVAGLGNREVDRCRPALPLWRMEDGGGGFRAPPVSRHPDRVVVARFLPDQLDRHGTRGHTDVIATRRGDTTGGGAVVHQFGCSLFGLGRSRYEYSRVGR